MSWTLLSNYIHGKVALKWDFMIQVRDGMSEYLGKKIAIRQLFEIDDDVAMDGLLKSLQDKGFDLFVIKPKSNNELMVYASVEDGEEGNGIRAVYYKNSGLFTILND
ncbi:MAG: hypothetical protein HC892_20710 [Saprospiraceae bacterium]|nr:hypothetical protein [Saprospiraceae bacterium]